MVPKEETVKTDSKPKNVEDIVKALRAETANNKVLNEICRVFAMRERARDRVTIGSLRQTMYKEGLNFSALDLEKALKFMASVGIGKLHYDRAGKIQALKDIKITLQSIGKAAVDNSDTLETYSSQKKFMNLPTDDSKKPKDKVQRYVEEIAPQADERRRERAASDQAAYEATLSVNIEGKVVNFPLPPITPKELGEILSQGYAKKY